MGPSMQLAPFTPLTYGAIRVFSRDQLKALGSFLPSSWGSAVLT